MFFSTAQIIETVEELGLIHPFFGITFLTCKKASLPVGKKIEFPMDQKTLRFLEEHHRLNPISKLFYQPFITSSKQKRWVRTDYPSSGLQAINTQTFGQAFLHDTRSRLWGWQKDYVDFLKSKLDKGKKIAAFDLAVWIFRTKQWPKETTPVDVIKSFFTMFNITREEQYQLFDDDLPDLGNKSLFQDYPVEWSDLSPFIQSPPDAGPDQGGTLSLLELNNLGPVKRISFTPAKRLNIITGDNGLGKSFLLECAWWALTSVWAETPAYPNKGSKQGESSIAFELTGRTAHPERKEIKYDTKLQLWPRPAKRPTIPGLIVYARVDGSFAIWDPARFSPYEENSTKKASLVFSRSEVWDGLPGNIEGLIRDWIRWQSLPEKYPFDIFRRVLRKLSPPDLGELVPGESIRVPNDPRDIPTIVHPYGTIPIIFESAGIRRIITMAYLMVWAWNEHLIHSDLSGTKPQPRMVVMIDEIEAHLHPKWQRAILPALLDVQKVLSNGLEIQFLVTTHSPLVMASSEAVFNDDYDELFHLYLDRNNVVELETMDYIKFGQVDAWLTSSIFEMRHARSNEAEVAIEAAKNLQKQKNVDPTEVRRVTDSLIKYLAAHDQFWPRWVYFAERYGVKL